MSHYFKLLLFILLILSSCRPSARFSASKVGDKEEVQRTQNSTHKSSDLNNFVKQWLHTPYKYGGMNRSGVDCSGFSSIAMRVVYDLMIPRTAQEQFKNGEKIRDSWRHPGDLVFFKNTRGHGIDHVGIFLGNNRFAHASESSGVVVSDLDEEYYRKRYAGARRYIK